MQTQSWVSIFGNAQIDDGVITLLPDAVSTLPSPDETPAGDGTPPTSAPPPHVLVRSNLEFEQGSIVWEAKLGDANCRAQLMLPAVPDASSGDVREVDLSVGLNVLGTPYGFGIWTGKGWEAAGGAGLGSILPVGEWIPLKLIVRGSTVELFVQGVRVSSTTRVLRRGQIGVLLQGMAETSIRNLTVIADAPMCFVIMQFSEEFDALYRDVIRPTCESYGYKVVRADDFYTPVQIIDDVTRSIRAAALIIADVTPRNENVFYEVGYAHAIGKPTILLSDKKRERLPFDIAGFRTLFYDNTIGGKGLVESRLKQHLNALTDR